MIVRPRLLDALEPAARGAAADRGDRSGRSGQDGARRDVGRAAPRRGSRAGRDARRDVGARGRAVGDVSRAAFGVDAARRSAGERRRAGRPRAGADATAGGTRALVFDDFHLADGVVARQFADPSARRAVGATARAVRPRRSRPGAAPYAPCRDAGRDPQRRAGVHARRGGGAARRRTRSRCRRARWRSCGSEPRAGRRGCGWRRCRSPGTPEPEAFVAEFAGDDRAVVAYLIDEVLARQSDAARELLLATAVVDRVSAPLANALTGRDDAADVLDALVAANALVIPLDRRGEWFRYHALLADLLRALLARRGPEAVERQHRRAAAVVPGARRTARRRCAIASRRATGTASRRCSPSTGSRCEPTATDRCSTTRCGAFPRPGARGAALRGARRRRAVPGPRRGAARPRRTCATAVAGRARVAGARRARFARDLALVRLQRAARDGDVATALRQQAVVDAARDDDPVRGAARRCARPSGARRACAWPTATPARRCTSTPWRGWPARGCDDVDLVGRRRRRARVAARARRRPRAAPGSRSRLAREGGADASGVAALAEALVAAEVGDLQGAPTQLAAARARSTNSRASTGGCARSRSRSSKRGSRCSARAPPPRPRAMRCGCAAALARLGPLRAQRLADLAHAELADLLVRLGRADEALALLTAVLRRRGRWRDRRRPHERTAGTVAQRRGPGRRPAGRDRRRRRRCRAPSPRRRSRPGRPRPKATAARRSVWPSTRSTSRSPTARGSGWRSHSTAWTQYCGGCCASAPRTAR